MLRCCGLWVQMLEGAGLDSSAFDVGVDLGELQPDDAAELVRGDIADVDEAVEGSGGPIPSRWAVLWVLTQVMSMPVRPDGCRARARCPEHASASVSGSCCACAASSGDGLLVEPVSTAVGAGSWC